MGRDIWKWFYRGVGWLLALAATFVLVSTVSRWKLGEIDPLSVTVALALGVLAIMSVQQGAQAVRQANEDVVVWAARLSSVIRKTEATERLVLLGGQDRVINVDFDLIAAPAHNAAGAAAEGTLAEVAAYFRALAPQRLVITGPPGSGKTVLAIDLLLGLLEDPRNEEPVPVRVSAASWDPAVSIEDWLTSRLVADYRMTRATARALLNDSRILPVIDGLDEMDPNPPVGETLGYSSRAAKAVGALNAFQEGRSKQRLILTCRTDQYDELTNSDVFAFDAARIALRPVGPASARRFLTAVVGDNQIPRWQRVLDALAQSDGALSRALSTPWRLTLAAMVYQQRNPDTGRYLHDPGHLSTYSDPDQIRDHLLGHYIPAVLAQGSNGYRVDRTHVWLAALARYLDGNTSRSPIYGRTLSDTDITIHELWPLAGPLPYQLTIALTFFLTPFTAAALWLVRAPQPAIIALTMFLILTTVLVGVSRWPEPTAINFRCFNKGTECLAFVMQVAIGLFVGFWIGLWALYRFSYSGGLLIGPALGLVGGLISGLVGANISRGDPRNPIRDDLLGWLVVGLIGGISAGVAVALTAGIGAGLTAGLVIGLTAGFAVRLTLGLGKGYAIGFVGSLAGPGAGALLLMKYLFGPVRIPMVGSLSIRYMMLILCTRGKLPWRPSRFLHRCYMCGLLRISGISYQFRHRELQDYLVSRPFPESF